MKQQHSMLVVIFLTLILLGGVSEVLGQLPTIFTYSTTQSGLRSLDIWTGVKFLWKYIVEEIEDIVLGEDTVDQETDVREAEVTTTVVVEEDEIYTRLSSLETDIENVLPKILAQYKIQRDYVIYLRVDSASGRDYYTIAWDNEKKDLVIVKGWVRIEVLGVDNADVWEVRITRRLLLEALDTIAEYGLEDPQLVEILKDKFIEEWGDEIRTVHHLSLIHI